MGDMLRDGADWLASMQRTHVAGTIRYERPGTQLVVSTLIAGVATTVFEQMTDTGIIRSESADWIVHADDLVFDDGTAFEPERGDLIIDTSRDGYATTYEVRGPDLSTPPWRWADRHRRQARIHSTQRRNTPT